MKLAKVVTMAGGRVLLGRPAVAIETDNTGRPSYVRHVDQKSGGSEERIATTLVLANCAPSAVIGMVDEQLAARLQGVYNGRDLSISLFSAHFGLKEPPSKFGLDRYSAILLPDWLKTLGEVREFADILGQDPSGRLPGLGIANYGAIEAGLSNGGPTLVSVVGPDRLSNWMGLTPDVEKDRRARWLDAIIIAVDRQYPGFAGAVTDKLFLNARSMQGFLNTPGGAVYGFAPLPPQRSILAGFPRSPSTPVPGLYLASSFAGGGGFTGAMVSGANAARLAVGH